jgi:hypothetical protein
MADFSLREVYQKNSFAAVMARQMGTAFPQALIQAPGIGNVPGFPQIPVAVPGPRQTSVRSVFPPTLVLANLAVPGHRLSDALNLRPASPLSHPDPKQTVTNLILGIPSLLLGGDKPLWTQVEYAAQMNPTLALVELGYTEALEAAVKGDPGSMPSPSAFRADYAKVLAALRFNFSQVVATTIPDPADTAYFSTLASFAQLIGTPAGDLASRYGIKDGDLLAPQALFEMSADSPALQAGSVTSGATVADIRNRVRALNSEIAAAAKDAGAILYDMNALFARMRTSGLAAGNLRLTANYLGGIYTLSGSFPGMTAHAQIANEILALLNQTYNTRFELVDLSKVAPKDPAVRFRPYLPQGVTK